MQQQQQLFFCALFLALFTSSTSAISQCNCVAFRLSSVQDRLQIQQRAILDLFHQYQIPLTLGLVPSQLNSPEHVSAIQSALQDSIHWKVELACNGFQLQNYSSSSQQDQLSDLHSCASTIESTFGRIPVTFIPPRNSYNDDTLAALPEAGFTHFSSSESGQPGPYDNILWKFPSRASTGRVSNNVIRGESADRTWGQIQNQIEAEGWSVVAMQPQEFSRYNPQTQTYDENYVNDSQMQELKELLWKVRSSGKRVVLIGELDLFLEVPYYPPCVAFRLDDIQDFYMTHQQESVLQVFKDYSAPISVGIIANYFGNDSYIVNSVKSNMRPGFEIHSHGWNHEDFTVLAETEQENLLAQSAAKIQQVLGVRTTFFIPPFNAWNLNTIAAMINQGFNVISSEVSIDPPPYNSRTNPPANTVWRWPIGATTSTQNSLGNYIGTSASESYDQIVNMVTQYGFGAVMIHPFEFAGYSNGAPEPTVVNNTQVDELKTLLERVGLSGFKLVPLSELSTC